MLRRKARMAFGYVETVADLFAQLVLGGDPDHTGARLCQRVEISRERNISRPCYHHAPLRQGDAHLHGMDQARENFLPKPVAAHETIGIAARNPVRRIHLVQVVRYVRIVIPDPRKT